MDNTTAKKIQALFGHVLTTELKEATSYSGSNCFPLYSGGGDEEDTNLSFILEQQLIWYLGKKVFMFLAGKRDRMNTALFINPQVYLDILTKTTPNEKSIELGLKLCGKWPNYDWVNGERSRSAGLTEYYAGGPNWIGKVRPTSEDVIPGSDPPLNNWKNISSEWFKHFQYQYFDRYENDIAESGESKTRWRNIGALPTMLLYYDGSVWDVEQKLNPRMWETNIPEWNYETDERNWKDVDLPGNSISGQLKKLYWPRTSFKYVYEDQSRDPVFKRRNYCKIVNGMVSMLPDNDQNLRNEFEWVDEAASIEPINTDADALGDIDRTLKSLTEFMDDFMGAIRTSAHKGKVIFSASTQDKPLGSDSWKNVIDLNPELMDLEGAMVWTGSTMVKGENEVYINALPNHHHNTLGTGRNIANISIIGRPEGETVGGVAKVETAEKVDSESKTTTSIELPKDTEQNAALTVSVSVSNKTGAYTGTVVYNQLRVDADKKPHNNIPPYYKIRGFVYMGVEPNG